MGKYPGWRTMTASQRINARREAHWEEARRLERERRAQGLEPNLALLPPDKIYIVFCRQLSGEGTTWIDKVKAHDLATARMVAEEKCSEDWNGLASECFGVIEGDAKVLFWNLHPEDHCFEASSNG